MCWPSWSCDLDNLYKLSFPLPMEALIGQAVLEKWTLDGQTPEHGYTLSSLDRSLELKIKKEAYTPRRVTVNNKRLISKP